MNERQSERIYRIGEGGRVEEAIIARDALIVGVGCLSDPRAPTLTPVMDSVDWRRMVYTVKGDSTEHPIPANHVRASEVWPWRPSKETP